MVNLFGSPPEPKTNLGRYRVLSPLAGVRVSPLCLGAMSIGSAEDWVQFMGSMGKEASVKLLDAFFDAGGNFIDTANNYQDGTSEEIIGEWAEARGIRDQLVIATKYSMTYKRGDKTVPNQVAFMGNNSKSLFTSVETSLKRLKTNYIDILYVHWWDWETSIEEVMNSLHHLVSSRKVLYLGISDTPAWVVAKANTYAQLMGKTPFVLYQGSWNVMDRTIEKEILPMARDLGLAIAPWNVLAGGKLRTDEEEKRRAETGEKGRALFNPEWKRTEQEVTMSRTLEKIAKELDTKHITAVAIAYLLQRTPYVFPIVGGRKIEHLLANIEALSVQLTPEHIKMIEEAAPSTPEFPYTFIGDGTAPNIMMTMAAHVEKLPYRSAIRPRSTV